MDLARHVLAIQELRIMPTISLFYGIVIQMYWRDHGPPHFHALYGEHEALVDLRDSDCGLIAAPRAVSRS